MTRSAPEAASRPSLDEVARQVARQVRECSPAYRCESEAALAGQVGQAIEAVLASADSGSSDPIRRYAETLVPLRARQGVTAPDLAVYATALEGGIGRLVAVEQGEQALGNPRWRRIQAVIRDAMQHLAADVAEYRDERRDGDLSRLAALLDTLPDVVILVDEQNVVQHANGALREQLRVEPAEILGEQLDQTFLPRFLELQDDPDGCLARTREILAAPDRVHEDELRLRDGRVIRCRSVPVFGEAFIGRLLIIADVTAQRERGRRTTTLLSHLVAAQERERTRIAGDLHDGPVQVLAAALLRLESLSEKLGDLGDERLPALARVLVEDLRRAYDETRTVLFNLSPELLEESDLPTAVGKLLDRFRLETGVETRLEGQLDGHPARELELVAFRVLQEALANVRRHARAGTVVVRLSGGPDIECELSDDGAGFDPELLGQRLRAGHIGVASMRERVELAGGSFELESAPGAGTAIRFVLPLLAA